MHIKKGKLCCVRQHCFGHEKNHSNFAKFVRRKKEDWHFYFNPTGIFTSTQLFVQNHESQCCQSTLGFLPKIPFKLTQSIQFLTLKPIKGTLGFILKMLKKIGRWRHKSEISKRNVKTMISPLLFCLLRWLGCQKKQYDQLKFI